jgi:hypothetical protein
VQRGVAGFAFCAQGVPAALGGAPQIGISTGQLRRRATEVNLRAFLAGGRGVLVGLLVLPIRAGLAVA